MTSPPYDASKSESDSALAASHGSGEPLSTSDKQTFTQQCRQWGATSQRYVVEEKLAEGGMGIIYKVKDRGLQRNSALKVSLLDLLQSPALMDSFIQEAQITGQLEHPNIIPVHDIGIMDDERPFFSMKLMKGETLIEIIGKLYNLDPAYEEQYNLFKLLTICRKVCDAVAFAHSKDVIHRDIKPDNIIVGDYGEVLLLDWGIARQAQPTENPDLASQDAPSASPSATLTQFGEVKGTPAYMSPEQAMGVPGMVDKRTDIFLLGATLYTVATLQMPYSGRNVQAILSQAERGRPVPPQRRARKRQIPDALNQIIMRCMAFDPGDRYPSVEALINDLDALMAGEMITKQRRFTENEVLMQEGEQGREAYVILSGEVSVSTSIGGQPVRLYELGQGDTVGEMALISNAPRSATVTALTATEVMAINAELMQQALEKLPPWLGQIIQALSNRLRQMTERVHPLKQGGSLWHTLHQLEILYPIYAKPLTGHGTDDQDRVMSLPFEETSQEIAHNLCLDATVITQMMQVLCRHDLLRMLDDSHFTIPNYEYLCQFVDYAREAMGHPGYLKVERQSNVDDGDTDLQVSYQSLLEIVTHDVTHGLVERSPSL